MAKKTKKVKDEVIQENQTLEGETPEPQEDSSDQERLDGDVELLEVDSESVAGNLEGVGGNRQGAKGTPKGESGTDTRRKTLTIPKCPWCHREMEFVKDTLKSHFGIDNKITYTDAAQWRCPKCKRVHVVQK